MINRLVHELGPLNPVAPVFLLASAMPMLLRTCAEQAGRSDFTLLWCGQNASGCRASRASWRRGLLVLPEGNTRNAIGQVRLLERFVFK